MISPRTAVNVGRRRASRWVRQLHRTPKPAFSDLDQKLSQYLTKRDGFFIEAGANDGYSQSNTYRLETELGWSGLLVEGIPDLAARCTKLRVRSTVVNCGLVDPDYLEQTVRMRFADLMSLVEGAQGDTEAENQHVQDGLWVQGLTKSYEVDVVARTLESLLDELDQTATIDFMSLDVEGYELNVLRGMNLAKYRPRYLLVEARFYDEVDIYLREHQYVQLDQLSHHDFLYGDSLIAS